MSDNNTAALRNWLVALALAFILILFLIIIIFTFLIEGLSIEQRLDYGTKALTTTGTIFAGIAVFINAFYAAKRAEAMDKSAEAANESAKAALKNAEAALKNAQAAEDKQITERFAKAIEQLGNEKIEIRLGAIYTLERIAKDSPKDHWTIMEILTAFARENAPVSKEQNQVEDIEDKPKIRTDIQASITVIGRRNCKNDQENLSLDLSNTDIRGANVFKANLQRVNFYQANLQSLDFSMADNLQGIVFIQANLQGARFCQANLQEVIFYQANLQKASFYQAHLQKAGFYQANLQGADFRETDLQDVSFKEAKLQGAYLTGVKNLRLQQIESAIGDRTTRLPDNLETPSHWRSL